MSNFSNLGRLRRSWCQCHENFDDRMLSDHFPQRFEYEWSCPPYFPDLNPCDYFLWRFLKDAVYKRKLHPTEELQREI
jgi:hypothetical protein